MESDKFLCQIADYYIGGGRDLSKTIMVFPNRRSALFLRKYMYERMSKPMFMPRMVSITYFTGMFDSATLADELELVCILYKVYCRVLKSRGHDSQVPDFDKFYFWGLTLLKDFNDIDAYLVDAAQIFKNIKSVREISANYLTAEQLEVAEMLWGDKIGAYDPDIFWNHVRHDGTEAKSADTFLSLWEIMYDLHTEFIKELEHRPEPLTYSGLQSRRACEKIKEMTAEDFNGYHYIFVGFNVLSTSRAVIFKRMQQLGIVTFFWDVTSPLLESEAMSSNRAARYILSLARRFPMPEDFGLVKESHVPEIEIIGVPSNTGQAKAVADVLSQWSVKLSEGTADGRIPEDQLLNTAVVMADESLLMPMLYSIPPQYHTINVTMGLPYMTTPFAALMSSVISMHLRGYVKGGAYHYFYRDVLDVLSHPHIELIAPEQTAKLADEITSQHIFNVSADEIKSKYPDLAFLFSPITDCLNINDVKRYMTNLINGLSSGLRAVMTAGDRGEYYELSILEGYAMTIEQLCRLVERYGVEMRERTFLQMIERTLAMTRIAFAGEPLKGLQIMGVMDTRVLDFDNLIMMSMNEKVFPTKKYSASLIPANLRAAYHMPTHEHEEASYSYQFFRLISHARRVKLIYDTRTSGISSGEMSRYMSQLLHLKKDYDIKITDINYHSEASDPVPIEVVKSAEVIAELREFRPGGKRKLSASALKAYLACPLRFYLQYVKGIRSDDRVMEYIDAASYGTVIHYVAECLYRPYTGKRINNSITKIMLGSDIEHLALKALNEKYYKGRYTDRLDRMPGEGQITAKVIARYFTKMLERELAYDPFIYKGGEVGEHTTFTWQINDKYCVNFKMSVDRIDILRPAQDSADEVMRFIDYKTGSDGLKAKSVEELFTNDQLGGMFQLLVYSHAYAAITGYKGKIQPLIYKFQTIPTEGIPLLTIANTDITDYRMANDGETNFYERFEQVIDRIFEEEGQYSFHANEDSDKCRFCPFASLCRRYVDSSF